MSEEREAPLDPSHFSAVLDPAQPLSFIPNPLGGPSTLIPQTRHAAHTHQAQVTPKPVPPWGLRETSEAATVVMEGVGPGQEAGQEPGGPHQ